MSSRRAARIAGLLLVAGAAITVDAAAQDTTRTGRDTASVPIPQRPDSIRGDSVAPGDTTAADTLKAPLARAPRPRALDVGGDYVWDRQALFASGAFSLLDLLEQVPGVSGLRAGWLLPPEHASYVGAGDRIRVFQDGVELDQLHPRSGGLYDLSSVELWPLEEVMIERAAGELRVHLRSWRVQRTTPDSRTDVATGEYRTNLFRGFFGRRFGRGEGIQAGFQQYSTREPTFGGDGDQLALFARLGWAAGPWSVDGYYQRSRRTQEELERRLSELPPLAAFERAAQLAYLRGGYRDPTAPGLWAQAILSSQLFGEASSEEDLPGQPPGGDDEAASADTSRSRAQYVFAGGWNRGALELEGTARLRIYEGERHLSPSVRAGYATRLLSAQGRAELLSEDSTMRVDASVLLQPLERVRLVAAAGFVSPGGEGDPRPSSRSLRGEAGFRVGRTWLIGGVLNRQNAVMPAPVVYDADFAPVAPGTVTGFFAGARGPIYRDVSVDVLATQWTDGGDVLAYRPKQEVRARLVLDTPWLSRFPNGTFRLRVGGSVDHRSDVLFPLVEGGALTTLGATVVGGLLEIRIQDAVAFVQTRNMLAIDYEVVPGYRMPRNLLLYGVRWQFWN